MLWENDYKTNASYLTDFLGDRSCTIKPIIFDNNNIKNDVGVDMDRVYSEDDLARGNELGFAGWTKGELLDGIKFTRDGAVVHSLRARLPSGTVETSTTLMRFKSYPVYERPF